MPAGKSSTSRRSTSKRDAEINPIQALRVASELISRSQLASRANLTFAGARDVDNVLGYKSQLEYADYHGRFERNGVAERLVTTFPKATWRGGVKLIEDENLDITTPFEAAWESLVDRLKVWSVLQKADTLAGIGRYATVLIGAGGKLDTELPQMKGPDDIVYLKAYGEQDMKVTTLELQTDSPRFGQPLTYEFRRNVGTAGSLAAPVHWTRIIHIADTLDDQVYGKPRLQGAWNRLDDLEKVVGGGSEAFWLRAHQGFVFNLDPLSPVDQPELDKMREHVEEFAHQMRRTIGVRGADIKAMGSDVAGIRDHVESIFAILSACSGIPKRILMGTERGELASQQDERNFDDQIQDRRTDYAAPVAVRPLADRLIFYGATPKPVMYVVSWPEMRDLSIDKRADVAVKLSTINKNMGETVVTGDEIRDRALGMGPLDEADKEPVEPDQEETQDTQLPVAAAGTEPPAWVAVQSAANRSRGPLRSILSRAMVDAAKAVPFVSLQEPLRGEDVDTVDRIVVSRVRAAIEWIEEPVAEQLLMALSRSGSVAARQTLRQAPRGLRRADSAFAFDRFNPAAGRWAETAAASLVTNISESVRTAIRAALAKAFEQGIQPSHLARLLRGLVGLTERQSVAVMNARFRLLEAAPGTVVQVGKVAVHIPRNGTTTEFVNRVATEYSARLLRQRTLLIAGNETLAAANEGQRLSWLQAVQRGFLPGVQLRAWALAGEKTCPQCVAMAGQQVGLEQPFKTPDGVSIMSPPLHPGCTCAEELSERRTSLEDVA